MFEANLLLTCITCSLNVLTIAISYTTITLTINMFSYFILFPCIYKVLIFVDDYC